MDRRKLDVVFTTVLIIASLVILQGDNLVKGGVETDLGSLFLPRIVAVAILFFSAMIGIPSLLNLLRNAPPGELEHVNTEGFLGIGVYFAILIAYWYFVPHIGFLLATPVVMFSIAVLLGGRSWAVMSGMSVVVTLVVYYGSKHFLRVFLPEWTLS
jgi:putative tricarboxylic transport membrane protein